MSDQNQHERPKQSKLIFGLPIALLVVLALPGLAVIGFVAAVAINQFSYVASINGQNVFEYFFSSMPIVQMIKDFFAN